MAVPTTILDLSTTEASNSPAGSDSAGGTVDNYLRAAYKILRDTSLLLSWERWNDTPTYISATSFSVAGNLTSRYTVGRILKCTVTAGTCYCRIATSAYASVTTVTVTNLSGTLDSGLSEVALGPDINSMNGIQSAALITGGSVTGITDITVADGGTGASDAQTARVNLGLQAISAKTFYVRTDGSDSNDGSANTAGSAFLTIQKAINTAKLLAYPGGTVTISVADGTYAEDLKIYDVNGYTLALTGNTGTPGNVVIKTLTVYDSSGMVTIDGFSLTNSTATTRIYCGHGYINVARVTIGAATANQVSAVDYGVVVFTSNFTVTGSSGTGLNAILGEVYLTSGITVTITGTPAYSSRFAYASYGGVIDARSITFSGSATGTRYVSDVNGIINTNGGGATYLPGNSAGSTATQGQYL